MAAMVWVRWQKFRHLIGMQSMFFWIVKGKMANFAFQIHYFGTGACHEIFKREDVFLILNLLLLARMLASETMIIAKSNGRRSIFELES